MKIVIRLFFLPLSFLSSQVFSEYSYVGANQAAMVGSINANIKNESGLFQNPASITGFEDRIILIGQSNIFNQSYLPYQYLGAIYKLPIINNIGISYHSFSTENNGVKLSSETAISITKGIFLQRDKNSSLAVGFRVSSLFWDQAQSAGPLGDGSGGFNSHQTSVVGADFGIIGGLRNKYWVGGYLSNINSPILNGQNLPRKISISLGFNPFDKVYTNLSMERLLGRNDRQVKMGFKYNLNNHFSLFSGIQSNPNRFGLGIEYRISQFALSYSILTHHVMRETHSIEVKIK